MRGENRSISIEDVRSRWLVAVYLALSLGHFAAPLIFDYSYPYLLTLPDLWVIAWLCWKWRTADLDLKDALFGPAPLSRRHVLEALGLAGVLMFFTLGYQLLGFAVIVHFAPEFGLELYDRYRDYRFVFNAEGLMPNVVRAGTVIVIGPVLEEILDRGVLLRRWAWKFGALRALVLSSLLFGALHYFAFFGAFIWGMVFGLLYLRSGNLLVPILAHSVFNAIGSGLELMVGIFLGLPAGPETMGWWWGLGGIALAISTPLLVLVFVRSWPLLTTGPRTDFQTRLAAASGQPR